MINLNDNIFRMQFYIDKICSNDSWKQIWNSSSCIFSSSSSLSRSWLNFLKKMFVPFSSVFLHWWIQHRQQNFHSILFVWNNIFQYQIIISSPRKYILFVVILTDLKFRACMKSIPRHGRMSCKHKFYRKILLCKLNIFWYCRWYCEKAVRWWYDTTFFFFIVF